MPSSYFPGRSELIQFIKHTYPNKWRRAHRQRRHDPFQDPEAPAERVGGVKQRLLVLLQVLVVRRRDALQRHHEAGQLTKRSARFASKQLERVGVLLLGHDARAGRVGVGEREKAKLGGRVDDEVLGQLGDVQHDQARPEQELGHKVSVGDGVHRVDGEGLEAELLADRVARQLERVAGHRS